VAPPVTLWRLRAWRRVLVLTGVWVNVGKTGATSVTFGRRGLRYTVGRRGRRATVCLPCTGLFLTGEEGWGGGKLQPLGSPRTARPRRA
jgi:hypothetical protein